MESISNPRPVDDKSRQTRNFRVLLVGDSKVQVLQDFRVVIVRFDFEFELEFMDVQDRHG